MKREYNGWFMCGVLSALGIVYLYDQETIAAQIMKECGVSSLLRVARKNENVFLPNLRQTANEVRRLQRLARGRE